MKRQVVIVHGYSDKGESAKEWCRRLSAAGYDASQIHVADYVTLSNEITIKDLSEAFDRAVRLKPNLNQSQPFDAIVHSTGMLVVRSWLSTYQARRNRLKHLIGLAPATWGSPLADQGRSLLGAVFKGSHHLGPDFMEQGDRVLAALELGSSFTWDLAHKDLVTDTPVYGPDGDTPYPFIFVGLKDYGFIKSLVTESLGTDGTVRWAGVGFNCRRIEMDLSIDPASGKGPRVSYRPWKNTNVPMVLLRNHNHGTIFTAPDDDLVEAVTAALQVETADQYAAWKSKYEDKTLHEARQAGITPWQQFIIHLIDERSDGISDYYVDLYTKNGDTWMPLEQFAPDVHAFSDDPSYRCFHVNIAPFAHDNGAQPKVTNLWLRLIASSGTKLVAYFGYGTERITDDGLPVLNSGKWDAAIDLTPHLQQTVASGDVKLFYPFTTTLVEIRMNREPMPLGINREPDVFKLLAPPSEPD